MKTLAFGLLTGVFFGFLLQRARVLRYEKQLGMLRLEDMTVIKFMVSAVLTGMAGTHVLYDLGLAQPSIKPTILGANAIGGLIFGAGWALLGYCPGTAVGAVGEGRLDALWGVLGMLAGAALFAEVYPALAQTVMVWGNLGGVTLPGILGASHWVVVGCMAGGGVALCLWFERKGL